jgi:hypothetical protein
MAGALDVIRRAQLRAGAGGRLANAAITARSELQPLVGAFWDRPTMGLTSEHIQRTRTLNGERGEVGRHSQLALALRITYRGLGRAVS